MRRIALLACVLALACIAAPAGADGIAPTEGGWRGLSAAGLPLSFDVREGHVVNARFKFRWGFCGTFLSVTGGDATIDPSGHWKTEDSRGPWIEASFVAPDRAEGVVGAPSRMLPGCPLIESHFTATPGEPFPEPEARVRDSITSEHLARRPHRMILSADGSFYIRKIHWQTFGGALARGTGIAYARTGCITCPGREVAHPRARLRLTHLEDHGLHRVYEEVHYILAGPLPQGFTHRGLVSLR